MCHILVVTIRYSNERPPGVSMLNGVQGLTSRGCPLLIGVVKRRLTAIQFGLSNVGFPALTPPSHTSACGSPPPHASEARGEARKHHASARPLPPPPPRPRGAAALPHPREHHQQLAPGSYGQSGARIYAVGSPGSRNPGASLWEEIRPLEIWIGAARTPKIYDPYSVTSLYHRNKSK